MHSQRLPVGRGKYCWQELLTHSESPPRWLAAFHVSTFTPAQVAFIPGTKGTSDFSNRFIIDGSRNEGIGSSAGSATQGANANVPPAGTGRAGGELAAAGHDRAVKTDPWESIPAFVTLIYIVKL
jgi:hypothetical protein